MISPHKDATQKLRTLFVDKCTHLHSTYIRDAGVVVEAPPHNGRAETTLRGTQSPELNPTAQGQGRVGHHIATLGVLGEKQHVRLHVKTCHSFNYIISPWQAREKYIGSWGLYIVKLKVSISIE